MNNNLPMLLVQEIQEDKLHAEDSGETEIIAIAVYGKGVDVPMPVSTQRVFEGESRFKFPTEITSGATKTRIVYRYTIPQWKELLESVTRPSAPAGLKQLMIPMLLHLKKSFPEAFGAINYDRNFDPEQYAEIITME